MASYNKVILLGNLTRDPQLSYTPSNTAAVEFSLATNRKWKDQSGQQREEVCFADCQMYGRRAEVINKYLHKGDPLFIEGRLKFDSWQAQDGTKRSKLRVMVETFEFLGGGKGRSGDGQGGGQPYQQQQAQASPAPQGPQDEPFAPVDDDIPF